MPYQEDSRPRGVWGFVKGIFSAGKPTGPDSARFQRQPVEFPYISEAFRSEFRMPWSFPSDMPSAATPHATGTPSFSQPFVTRPPGYSTQVPDSRKPSYSSRRLPTGDLPRPPALQQIKSPVAGLLVPVRDTDYAETRAQPYTPASTRPDHDVQYGPASARTYGGSSRRRTPQQAFHPNRSHLESLLSECSTYMWQLRRKLGEVDEGRSSFQPGEVAEYRNSLRWFMDTLNDLSGPNHSTKDRRVADNLMYLRRLQVWLDELEREQQQEQEHEQTSRNRVSEEQIFADFKAEVGRLQARMQEVRRGDDVYRPGEFSNILRRIQEGISRLREMSNTPLDSDFAAFEEILEDARNITDLNDIMGPILEFMAMPPPRGRRWFRRRR